MKMEEDLVGEHSDYDLDYSDESFSETDVDLENQYYKAKSLKEDTIEDALDAFQAVLDLQTAAKGIWGFKTLKQMIKIYFRMGNYEAMMNKYREMLTYIRSAVTKNDTEKSINSILDLTSVAKNFGLLKKIYETTLTALKENKNDRLWSKTNLKLGQVYLENQELLKLSILIKQLKHQIEPSQEEKFMDTQMLEVYALEIQMYSALRNYKEVKKIYKNCNKIRSAIPHPLIMSIIRECGGKMYLKAGKYEKAYTDFFEAFKNFDEAGSSKKYTCLKYLLLTSMLMKSEIDPFHSQEIRPYKNYQQLKSMVDLIAAYQSNNMKQFESVFQTNKASFMMDEFIAEHIKNLLQNVRTTSLLSLIKPYRQIKICFIAQELGVNQDEAEELVVTCILDHLINGRIDQVNNVFVMNPKPGRKTKMYQAMEHWASTLNKIILSQQL